MNKVSVIIICSVLITIFALFLSPGASGISAEVCSACHGSYFQYLDILEENSTNLLPTSIMVGETKNVSVLIENNVNTDEYDTMSYVSLTLSSLNGNFYVNYPTYYIGNLPKGTKTASWQIIGISNGPDHLIIEAEGINSHRSVPFSDIYDPSPLLTVVENPSSTINNLKITINGRGNVSPSAGTYIYGEDTNVTISASEIFGWTFSNWLLDSEDAGSNNPYTVTMNGNHSLTAVFTENPPPDIEYNLNIDVIGSGSTSPSDGSHLFGEDAQIVVNASADLGWNFSHWLLDSLNVGSNNPYTVTMNNEHALTAVFIENPLISDLYSLSISVRGSGITSPSVGPQSIEKGTEIEVSASTDPDWTFSNWLLDGVNVGSNNPYTVTMDNDHALLAIFTENPIPDIEYNLNIHIIGSGITSPLVGSHLHEENTEVTVLATANSGWTFNNWLLNTVNIGETNPYTLIMDNDYTLVAVFSENAPSSQIEDPNKPEQQEPEPNESSTSEINTPHGNFSIDATNLAVIAAFVLGIFGVIIFLIKKKEITHFKK